ncbi:MAG: glycosyltransferase [Cyanosarcina radialis HA8281-LM2]|jgi:glycosyltransferase involved in cell wall biosynthesis|nr:glycosyltransferase [Cyanosarcina radialis HA8281-LM2]
MTIDRSLTTNFDFEVDSSKFMVADRHAVPKISVVMPVYNCERYLREAVESVLNQSFTDFEFVIINDASTDSTDEILAEFARQDERIIILENQENLGLTGSLNKGIDRARGEYIARQDADDISLPERLKKQVALLDSNSEVVLVSCNIEKINAEGKPFAIMERACPANLVAWYLLFYNRLSGHSQVMFRRKTVNMLGGYSKKYPYCEDYELWCRLAGVGIVRILPEVLLQQRFHSTSVSAKKQAEQKQDILELARSNIKQLTELDLSPSEIENLNSFWVGHTKSANFLDSSNLRHFNAQMQDILKVFVQKKSLGSPSNSLENELKSVVGKQFIYWANMYSFKNKLFKKSELLLYAFNWCPLLILEYVQKSIMRIPLALVNSFARQK